MADALEARASFSILPSSLYLNFMISSPLSFCSFVVLSNFKQKLNFQAHLIRYTFTIQAEFVRGGSKKASERRFLRVKETFLVCLFILKGSSHVWFCFLAKHNNKLWSHKCLKRFDGNGMKLKNQFEESIYPYQKIWPKPKVHFP